MDKETLLCLKAHFSSPLKRIKLRDEEKIRGLVHFPLKDPSKPGGFTKAGEKWATENKLEELLELANEHRDKIRIEVHAVLKTAWLFLKSKKASLSEDEKSLLYQGISLGNPLNRLQTVKKGGSILTSEFEQNMTELYNGLSKESPESLSCKELLLQVAQEQKIARERDKEVNSSLLNI
jgi:hypothetical protein